MSIPESGLRIKLYQPQQRDFHESRAGFRSFIGGRGSGKTVVGAVDLALKAIAEKANYGIFAPTYGDLHDFTFISSFLKIDQIFPPTQDELPI